MAKRRKRKQLPMRVVYSATKIYVDSKHPDLEFQVSRFNNTDIRPIVYSSEELEAKNPKVEISWDTPYFWTSNDIVKFKKD